MDRIREVVDDLACGDEGCACNHPKEQYDELLAYVEKLEGWLTEQFAGGDLPSCARQARPGWLHDAVTCGEKDG